MSTIAGAPDLVAILHTIVQKHGIDILENRARLFALLRDYAPGDLRGVQVLMIAFDTGAPARLCSLPRPPSEAERSDEAAKLVDAYGSSPDLARSAVEIWARFAAGLRDRPPAAACVQTLPVRPLPLPAAPTGVQPLPGPSTPAEIRPLPLAQHQPQSGFAKWSAILIGLLVLAVAALVRLLGFM